MKTALKNNWTLFLIASLTLGLAPFNPPHILGKIQWILGGNAFSGDEAMEQQDYLDLVLHGIPWLLLLSSSLLRLASSKNKSFLIHRK